MKSLFLLNKLTTPIVILALGAGSCLTATQAYADHKHRQKQFHYQGQNQGDGYKNNRHIAQRSHHRKRTARER